MKLQNQSEQLKNELEKTKAAARQARLEEIEKRENVIRTRVEWMQEQERIRQEIMEKKLQTEMLEKQIESKEEIKEQLLKEIEDEKAQKEAEDKIAAEKAAAEKAATDEVANAAETTETIQETPKEEAPTSTEPIEEKPQEEEEVFPQYTALDVKGMKKRLTARLADENGRIISVKKGDMISGYVVKSVTKSDITFEKDGVERVIEVGAVTWSGAKNEETKPNATLPVKEVIED